MAPRLRPHSAVAERSMECQVAVHELWQAAVTTNDYVELSEARALADLINLSTRVARRISRHAEVADATGDPHGDQLGCGFAA